jgi:ATP-dependent Lon protease
MSDFSKIKLKTNLTPFFDFENFVEYAFSKATNDEFSNFLKTIFDFERPIQSRTYFEKSKAFYSYFKENSFEEYNKLVDAYANKSFTPNSTSLFDDNDDDDSSCENEEDGQVSYSTLKELNFIPKIHDLMFKQETKTSNISDLIDIFPNFKEVIEDIQVQINLSNISKSKSIIIPNTLLVGSGGIGKTYFLTKLKEYFNNDFFKIDCANSSKNLLVGTSITFGNAQPGTVFTSSLKSNNINNFWLLDEFDKIEHNDQFNLKNVFYTLLEKDTASSFTDQFFNIPVDLSKNYFFLTANNENNIEQPLLSRMNVYKVEMPNKDDFSNIIKNIYLDEVKKYDFFDSVIKEDICHHLTDHDNLREIKRNITKALSKAFVENRTYLKLSDFNSKQGIQARSKIGFL